MIGVYQAGVNCKLLFLVFLSCVEKEEHFRAFRDFKVPLLGQLLSEGALSNVGLSRFIL